MAIGEITSQQSESFCRKDGLKVFLDEDAVLNKIRMEEGSAAKVILAVSLRNARLTASNYARRHAPALTERLDEMFKALFCELFLPDTPTSDFRKLSKGESQ